MSRKSDIKTCRFVGCTHEKLINISEDEYVMPRKGMYYHPDCYEKQKNGEWKDKQTRADLLYIRDQWALRINRNVNYSQLMRILNEYVARQVPSEYLVFVFNYVIKNNMNLNYPNGFKYYVDYPMIKEAYAKSKLEKVKQSQFEIKDSQFEEPQKVQPSPQIANKPIGFGSILGQK